MIYRKKRKLVRINWTDTSKGEWHYVPIANVKVNSGEPCNAGQEVTVKYGCRMWKGVVAGPRKQKKVLMYGEYLPVFLFFFQYLCFGSKAAPCISM